MLRTLVVQRRWWFPILAVALWLASEFVAAQDAGQAADVVTPPTLGLQYLGDAKVQAELGLNAEQLAQLDELRAKFVVEFAAKGKKGKKGADEPKIAALPKLSDYDATLVKILGPDKAKRLGEIALQQSVRQFGDTRAVRYPYVVTLLQLSPAQQEALRFDEPLVKILTPEQQQKWQALVGKNSDVSPKASLTAKAVAKAKTKNITKAAVAPPANSAFTLLTNAMVEQELKLADQQIGGLKRIQDQITDKLQNVKGLPLDETATKVLAEFRVSADKQALELLQPDQRKRLGQIQNQLALVGKGPLVVFSDLDKASTLALAPEQVGKLKALEVARIKALEELFIKAERQSDLTQQIAQLSKKPEEDFITTLTKEQLAKYQDQVGGPFADLAKVGAKGKGKGGGGGFGGGGFGDPFGQGVAGKKAKDPPTTPLRLVTRMTPYLLDANLHKELKLSPDQVQKLQALNDRYEDELPAITAGKINPADYQDKLAARDQAMDKALKELLEPKQMQRFREIVVQEMLAPTKKGPLPTVPLTTFLRYTEVTDALKLTDAQRQQAPKEKVLDQILTAEQKATLKQLMGDPFAGKLVPSTVLVLLIKPQTLEYLENYSVRQELKLTDAQATRIKELLREWLKTEQPKAALKPSERRRLVAKSSEVINEVLQPAQAKRLRQLMLQPLGKDEIYGTRDVLSNAEAATELKLTAQQKQQLAALSTDFNAILILVNAQNWGVAGDTNELPVARVRKGVARAWDQRFLAVLTPEQRQQYPTLLGEPFTGRMQPVGGGFGGGGIGGGIQGGIGGLGITLQDILNAGGGAFGGGLNFAGFTPPR
jgi:hypothetical protein